jgi:hypothetical protein
MDFDKHITNATNIMKTSWNLINKELGTGQINDGIRSLNINGMSTTHQQAIASAFNIHFTTLPSLITRKITASSCLARNSANNQNNTLFSLNNVFQTPYPSIKYHRTTTKEIENIIKSLKSSNSFGYDEIPMKLLRLCSSFISSPLNCIYAIEPFLLVFSLTG